jgi:hypothetical protein
MRCSLLFFYISVLISFGHSNDDWKSTLALEDLRITTTEPLLDFDSSISIELKEASIHEKGLRFVVSSTGTDGERDYHIRVFDRSSARGAKPIPIATLRRGAKEIGEVIDILERRAQSAKSDAEMNNFTILGQCFKYLAGKTEKWPNRSRWSFFRSVK